MDWLVYFQLYLQQNLRKQTASEVPVVGSTKQLVCYADKRGFPEEVKAVRWYKDGNRISENDKYQIVWVVVSTTNMFLWVVFLGSIKN